MKAKIKTLFRDPIIFTWGKEYEVLNENKYGFFAVSDYGTTECCLKHGCAHLGGGEWTLFEQTSETSTLN